MVYRSVYVVHIVPMAVIDVLGAGDGHQGKESDELCTVKILDKYTCSSCLLESYTLNAILLV